LYGAERNPTEYELRASASTLPGLVTVRSALAAEATAAVARRATSSDRRFMGRL
jgi:hypothetical protein